MKGSVMPVPTPKAVTTYGELLPEFGDDLFTMLVSISGDEYATRVRAAHFYYAAGVPMYQARAFGDFVADHCPDMTLSGAVTEFNHSPETGAYLHRYGSACYGNHPSQMCPSCRDWAQFGD